MGGKVIADYGSLQLRAITPTQMRMQKPVEPGLYDGCEGITGGQGLGISYSTPDDTPLRGPFQTGCSLDGGYCYSVPMQKNRVDHIVQVYMQEKCIPQVLLRYVHCSYGYAVAVLGDGTCMTVGTPSTLFDTGQLEIVNAGGIIQVVSHLSCLVALNEKGTIQYYGKPLARLVNVGGTPTWLYEQLNAFSDWTEIVELFGTYSSAKEVVAGLQADGTLLVAHGEGYTEYDIANGWTGIKHVSIGGRNTRLVACKTDGTAVWAGISEGGAWENISSWTGIVQVGAASRTTIGLKEDGGIIYVGDASYDWDFHADLAEWPDDLIQISTNGMKYALGLRENGQVVSAGEFSTLVGTTPDNWENVQQVHVGEFFIGRTNCKCYANGSAAVEGVVSAAESNFYMCY